MATSQIQKTKGPKVFNEKDRLKHKNETVIEQLEREVKEIPKFGQLWIEKRWLGESLIITRRRFLTAFTGQARAFLHLGMGITDKESWTVSGNIFFTHHILDDKPVTFMWIDVWSECQYPEELEITLNVPKKMVPAILGKNTKGYSLGGKIQTDFDRLYAKKEPRK